MLTNAKALNNLFYFDEVETENISILARIIHHSDTGNNLSVQVTDDTGVQEIAIFKKNEEYPKYWREIQ